MLVFGRRSGVWIGILRVFWQCGFVAQTEARRGGLRPAHALATTADIAFARQGISTIDFYNNSL